MMRKINRISRIPNLQALLPGLISSYLLLSSEAYSKCPITAQHASSTWLMQEICPRGAKVSPVRLNADDMFRRPCDDALSTICLLYTSDAADDLLCVDLGGRRIIKQKKK